MNDQWKSEEKVNLHKDRAFPLELLNHRITEETLNGPLYDPVKTLYCSNMQSEQVVDSVFVENISEYLKLLMCSHTISNSMNIVT